MKTITMKTSAPLTPADLKEAAKAANNVVAAPKSPHRIAMEAAREIGFEKPKFDINTL